MKKRVLILAVGIMVALSLTACGKLGQDRTEDESVIEESDDESEVEAESEDVTEDKETDKADTDEQNKDTSEVISEAEPENDEEALHGPVDVDPVVASAPISEGYCQVDDLVYQPYITFAEFISLFEKSRLSKWIEMVYDPNQEVRDGQAYRIRCPKIGENEAFCEIIVDVINPTTDDDDILNINDY